MLKTQHSFDLELTSHPPVKLVLIVLAMMLQIPQDMSSFKITLKIPPGLNRAL